MDGRAVGLVKGSLEDIGNTEPGANLRIVFRNLQRKIPALQDVDAAQLDKRRRVVKAYTI